MPAKRLWATNRYTVLLAFLLALLLTGPIVQEFLSSVVTRGGITGLIFGIMLMVAVVATSHSRRVTIGLLVAIALLIPLHLFRFSSSSETLEVVRSGLGVLVLALLFAMSLLRLFRTRIITHDTISASLCAYLLVGVMFAELFQLIDAVSAEAAFVCSTASNSDIGVFDKDPGLAMYYSLITLSTLGYGDVLPVSPFARTAAAVEAVMGQTYLAVLVARLVGLHIAAGSDADS